MHVLVREERLRLGTDEVHSCEHLGGKPHVVNYATVAQGGPVDVAPKEPKGGRRRVTTPVGQEVSPTEFTEMVRDLGVEEEPQPAAARSANRPAGGRRARSRANGGQAPKPPQGDGGDGEKPKKPRNRRHGRPR